MNETDRTPRPSRREALKIPAAIAAAFALPATAPLTLKAEDQAEAPTIAHIHLPGGLHEKFRIPDGAERSALFSRFRDSLSPEQWRML